MAEVRASNGRGLRLSLEQTIDTLRQGGWVPHGMPCSHAYTLRYRVSRGYWSATVYSVGPGRTIVSVEACRRIPDSASKALEQRALALQVDRWLGSWRERPAPGTGMSRPVATGSFGRSLQERRATQARTLVGGRRNVRPMSFR
jgi:hypothetical protein